MTIERELEALLFLSPDPVPVEELADALRVEPHATALCGASAVTVIGPKGSSCSQAASPRL